MLSTQERFVTSGPVRLWTERSGHPGHPPVLLIMGQAAQGITCPDALVERLVARGAQVIRFDHRDTGLSSVVDFDTHPYVFTDLARDCLAVLDGYDIPSADIAGASMGGAIGQWLGVHAPDRVRSLTLLTTSPLNAAPGDLPAPSKELQAHFAAAAPRGVESDMACFRISNGPVRPFDEAGARAVLERAWARAIDPDAATHHALACRVATPDTRAPLSSITAPTTVVHGDADPLYALAHGEALAAAIPGARLHVVPGMGHVFFSPGLPEELADLIRLSD